MEVQYWRCFELCTQGIMLDSKNTPCWCQYCFSYAWKPWLFSQVPKNYWDNFVHQRQCLEWLFKEEGLTQWDDWTTVTTSQFQAKVGGLLDYYGYSTLKMLHTVYPECAVWNLGSFWRETSNQFPEKYSMYFRWLMRQHNITSLTELIQKAPILVPPFVSQEKLEQALHLAFPGNFLLCMLLLGLYCMWYDSYL